MLYDNVVSTLIEKPIIILCMFLLSYYMTKLFQHVCLSILFGRVVRNELVVIQLWFFSIVNVTLIFFSLINV